MRFQFLAEMPQRVSRRGEAEMGLVRGERVHEPRFDEERVSPLDGFLGLRRGALEDGVDRAQMRLAGAGGRADVGVDGGRRLACHRMRSG